MKKNLFENVIIFFIFWIYFKKNNFLDFFFLDKTFLSEI